MGRHAARIGPNWQAISADWRTKQLEYSWVRSLAGPGQHRDFWTLTQEALAWVAAKHGIDDPALLADIAAAYRHLDAFAEVPAMLRQLSAPGDRARDPVQRRAGHAGRCRRLRRHRRPA